MTNKPFTIQDLISPTASLGEGALVLIQGGTGTGKSVLAANADDPIMYINMDWNLRYVGKHTEKRVDWIHIPVLVSATLAERQAVLKKINTAWNFFLSGQPSPTFGEPYKSFVWDTHTALWQFVGPLKVEERVAASKNPGRDPSRLDYGDANAWMWSVASGRAMFRPDAYVICLAHEGPLFVQDPKNPSSDFRIEDPRGRVQLEGWKHTPKTAQLWIRLSRPPNAIDRNGKPKPYARTGEVLKFSDDESIMMSGERIAEPTWEDLKEMLEG